MKKHNVTGKISGKLIEKGEVFEGANYAERTFVLDVLGDKIPLKLNRINITAIDGYSVGAELTVEYAVVSRSWNCKWYVNLVVLDVHGE